MPTQKDFVYSKLCPHRGIGDENTLLAIKNGIKSSPFMVEFDVQWNDNDLFLGHPPVITNSRLVDALELFRNSKIIPKVDIKLKLQSFNEALEYLIRVLNEWDYLKILINIDGSISSDYFMKAETILLNNTSNNVLLNIDLERYKFKSPKSISAHLSSLARSPFSISPNLETNIDEIISFAKLHKINNIHFWSNPKKAYSIEELFRRIVLCEDNDIKAFLDIKTSNILI